MKFRVRKTERGWEVQPPYPVRPIVFGSWPVAIRNVELAVNMPKRRKR